MNLQRPSCAVAVALIATQILGPAVLWAADQRGIQIEETRRVVIAAISGEQLTVQSRGDSKALHFLEAVHAGDQLATGDRTVADVLIGNRAVVTMGPGTTAHFTAMSDEQTTVQVKKGLVRVAASAVALGGQGAITVQTPTGQVQTHGGIVRVLVDQPAGAAEHSPTGEARPYRASYSPNPTTVVAALTPGSETIQVEEGSAEIAGAGTKAVTVQAGQAVTMQAGQAGAISKLVNQAGMRAGVLATAGHSQTPKEGRDHLVALQVEQATALGNALTGAAETGKGKSGSKEDTKNVINGATGGVLLNSGSLVSLLFGGGNAANPASSNPTNTTGSGYGGHNNNGNFTLICDTLTCDDTNLTVNGGNALLVFTRKDPVEPFWIGPSNQSCLPESCSLSDLNDGTKVAFRPLPSITSQFTVVKELVLVGGTPNIGHGGIVPTETLIVRGAAPSIDVTTVFTNVAADPSSNTSLGNSSGNGLFPTDRLPAKIGELFPPPPAIVKANSTFVVETQSRCPDCEIGEAPVFIGGTLGQYSNVATPSPDGIVIDQLNQGVSHVDGAITATSSEKIPIVNLTGGVTLDQGTQATIGKTEATDTYFTGLPTTLGRKFSGSLLAVIGGNSQKTSLTVGDRLLGVYDGSTISCGDQCGSNGIDGKALLSVLDAKLKGPAGSIPLIDIAEGKHFPGFAEPPDRISTPNVKVTSALVTRSTIPLALDGALVAASAPLFALTKANMTTTSHFADLAGKQAQSLQLNDALVALNASKLTIENGHLLNLRAATATVNGYLFSLTNGSTLTLNKGALFSLTDGSSLNLNANAFGVFGSSGVNTLTINNDLCTATCFQLVNSANQPILLNGNPLKVAGATEDVVLPNNFNIFAAPGATASNADIKIDANDALFQIDGTSTLTINGTTVVGQ